MSAGSLHGIHTHITWTWSQDVCSLRRLYVRIKNTAPGRKNRKREGCLSRRGRERAEREREKKKGTVKVRELKGMSWK